MSSHAELIDEFLHAFWIDDRAALARLAAPDVVWDNVPFHDFSLANGGLEVRAPRIRRGVDALRASKTMMFRDTATGRPVSLDADGTSHEVISAAESPDGTVFQERLDRIGLRGAVVTMRCVGVFEFEYGRIAVWRDFFEHAHWTKQLALLGVEYVGNSVEIGKQDQARSPAAPVDGSRRQDRG